jgi:hypothetical protein
MNVRLEQIVMRERRLTVRQIAANAGIFVGPVDTILHDDLKMREVYATLVTRMLTETRLHVSQCVRQCYHVTWV